MASSKLNEDLKTEIFNCLVVDDLTIAKTAKKVGVAEKTIYAWVKDNESFGKFLARVRETKAHELVNSCEEIARDIMSIDPAKEDKESAKIEIMAKKAGFDMLYKLAGKYNRAAFGEKVDTDITSGGAPIKIVIDGVE